jgi:ABC-type Fe3+-hydroxamate transport system substrate-binding protein
MLPTTTPQRVVCLQPSATVILAALGQLERVVACTRYCADVCPEVKDGGRAIIADSWTAQSRQILAARPDLVIAAVPYQEKAVVEILKAAFAFWPRAKNARRHLHRHRHYRRSLRRGSEGSV